MTRIQSTLRNLLLFLREIRRGPIFSLLLAAGALSILMVFTACDCDNNGVDDCDTYANSLRNAQIASLNSQIVQQQQPQTTARINGTQETPNTPNRSTDVDIRYYRVLGINTSGAPPTSVDYTWRPPDGASDFVFTGRQPEPGWDPAQPVFTFRTVPPGETIPVYFALPAISPYGGSQVIESLTAKPNNGSATTAYFRTMLLSALSSATAASDVQLVASSGSGGISAGASPDMVDIWKMQRWYQREVPITSAQCQQAVDLLQSDAAFVALQIPEPAHNTSESILLPVYENPVIELQGGDGLVVQGSGTFRPDRFTFAANELPQSPDKVWVTFGAAMTPTLTCPIGKQTDSWEIFLDFQLDLSYAPDSCRGCTLDVFFCYEGQELPGSRLERYVARQQVNRNLERLVRSSDTPTGIQDFQDWGITCAGPMPMQLLDMPGWLMVGASVQAVTATLPVTLPVTLEGNVPNPPQLFDLQFNSSLAAGWHWTNGTQMITPPVSFGGGAPETVAYLVGEVPANTAAGMYSVTITTTLQSQPGDYRVARHTIWVGEWQPPPIGATPTPDPSPESRINLPIILRNDSSQ